MPDTTRDPVTERGAKLDALAGGYTAAADEAWRAYREQAQAAWDAYRRRLDGLSAEYQVTVDRIREQP